MRKIIFTILFILASCSIILADTEASVFNYVSTTADKKFVFVMLNPALHNGWLTDKYPQSGMYLNDGSTTLLWTVDWLNYVFLPGDGKHIVRRGTWARYSATYEEEAFSFFDEGRLLKIYRTNDLVDFPWLLPHTVSHYKVIIGNFNQNPLNDGVLIKVDNGEGYPINSGVEIDNENLTISIQTFHDDKYLFDLKTGEVISSTHPTRNTAVILFSVFMLGYFVWLYLRAKSLPQNSRIKISNIIAVFLVTFSLLMIPVISVFSNQINGTENYEYSPTVFDYAFLSIQMFPQYLLTNFKIISPLSDNVAIRTSLGTNLEWLIIFWFPCALIFTTLDRVLILTISKSYRLLTGN